MLNVLVACEESQAVCKEFRRLGHKAFSCDIQECSGGHPEWHIKEDVKIIDDLPVWDLIIAFPPCTDLAVSGARWFKEKAINGTKGKSLAFFVHFLELPCKYIAVENPVNIVSGKYCVEHYPIYAERHNLPLKPTQTIQPWMFGHGETKKTCLWLKNLPPLEPTNIVEGREQRIWKMPPSEDRGKLRSKTYSGIARAMAEQWSTYLEKEENND